MREGDLAPAEVGLASTARARWGDGRAWMKGFSRSVSNFAVAGIGADVSVDALWGGEEVVRWTEHSREG